METLSQYSAENMNVLLVEDDPMNQFIAKTFLTKWGLQVVIANNGKEAIEIIQSKKFSIVLMDIHMPVMDGGEAVSTIRAMAGEYFRSVPILAFSAVIETKEKAMEMGMTDYANKPINPAQLQSKISQYAFSTIASSESRKLNIDFNVYTDGDEEFKQELTSLMINNLHELGRSVDHASEPGGTDVLHRIIHKVKPTLGMLNDADVTETIELLKSANVKDTAFDKLKNRFSSLNQQIIMALEKELKSGNLVFVPAKAA